MQVTEEQMQLADQILKEDREDLSNSIQTAVENLAQGNVSSYKEAESIINLARESIKINRD